MTLDIRAGMYEAAMLTLEVVPLPVTDVDRACAFYTEGIGFILDVDYRPTPDFRVVQLTPPGSACSVHLVAAGSGSRLHSLCLVTSDLAAERAKLIGRGVDVSEIRHKDPVETWAGEWSIGLDPQRRDYASFADFADPDGNTWTLQERGHRLMTRRGGTRGGRLWDSHGNKALWAARRRAAS